MLGLDKKGLKKIYAVIIVAIAIVAVFAGVAYYELNQPKPKKETFLLGIAMHTQVGVWHKALATYAQWFAEDIGMDVIVTNAEYDPALQIRQVQYLISAGINGLVWVPAETEAAAQVAKLCKDAGIPNITFNEDCNSTNVDLCVTVGYRKIARLLAQSMVDTIVKRDGAINGPIFEILGGLETPFSLLMDQGFNDTMSKYPNVTIYSYDANWDPATSKRRTEETILAHGKPVAIFAGGWGPLGDSAYSALESQGMAYPANDSRHVFVVCGDCSPEFLANIGLDKEDTAYTEVEQYLAGLPVYFCWLMMKNGIDNVKSALPSLGSELRPENLTDNLVTLGKEHFGLNPWELPQWWPAIMGNEYGHTRISMAGGLITKNGTAVGVTPDQIGMKAYDDPALYVNQQPIMKQNGFEGY